MANLMEHMMINKWDDEINSAITHVGGDTYGSEGLPDYADIIRTQLVANEAVGKGIYQDFLYVDQDNQTFINPWEGEPTTSTNAPQSSVIATTIKNLYDAMASTERYTVLLVDDFPKEEINLSAIYLVRSKCDCEGCKEGCTCKENTYTGCYYVKRGKELVRVDIPEFKYDLNELFYLTRAEYDASLSDYVKEIEDLLRKKFGKYWDDEGFTLDSAVEEIKKDLEEISAQIVAETNARLEEALATVNDVITGAETKLNKKFDDLSSEISTTIEGVHQDIADIESRVTKAESDIVEKFNELNAEFEQLEIDLNQNVTDNFNALKTEVDGKISGLDGRVEVVEAKITKVETDVATKFDELDANFDSLKTEVNANVEENFNTLKAEVQKDIKDIDKKVDTNFNSIMTSLQDYVKAEDLVAIDLEIEELK